MIFSCMMDDGGGAFSAKGEAGFTHFQPQKRAAFAAVVVVGDSGAKKWLEQLWGDAQKKEDITGEEEEEGDAKVASHLVLFSSFFPSCRPNQMAKFFTSENLLSSWYFILFPFIDSLFHKKSACLNVLSYSYG